MTELEYRSQIVSWLGRELSEEELVPIAALDALSPVQRAVAIHLAKRNALVATHFLRALLRPRRCAS